MKDYFFAATITGYRRNELSTIMEYTVITFFARNKDEALGIALNLAKTTKFPVSEGYFSHDAIIIQPSAEHLLLGLVAYGLN